MVPQAERDAFIVILRNVSQKRALAAISFGEWNFAHTVIPSENEVELLYSYPLIE